MSSLKVLDKRALEEFLEMNSGYVLDFSNRTFEEFFHEVVGIEVYSEKYATNGISKANRLRIFWKIESDYLVGQLLNALIKYEKETTHQNTGELAERCQEIASRLLSGDPTLDDLKQKAQSLDANQLAEQIRRMKDSVESDPSLAIGTAKELIETCCKTILAERGTEISGKLDIPALTKATLRELDLIPEGVSNAARGAGVIKRLLIIFPQSGLD